jgi:hypothetical protein
MDHALIATTLVGAQGFSATDKLSPGPIYLQPPFAVSSNKCTCSFIVLCIGGPFQPSVVSVTENGSSFSLTRYAHSSHYPRYIIVAYAIPLSPELSFVNFFYLLPCSFVNRLFLQPKSHSLYYTSVLIACPSCSVFHISQASPFFSESRGDISLYDFDATVIPPFKYLTWGDKITPKKTSFETRFACISKIWIHPAHHDFPNTVVRYTRISY